ncbi:MAG TPA: methyltransferase domain-containing protein [Gemmatimonadaceae bacterium]|nr:methyltransferase domain-containing protein [Gemmatimonadaceae bacterium]
MVSYDLTACPVCAASDAVEIASADDARAEMEMLWEFHQRRLRPGTPPRALADRVAFSQHPPLRLARCGRCTLIYRNPRERASELIETYVTELPDEATLRTLHENQRRAYRTQVRRLEQSHGRRGAGLEVGSYVGAFLGAARDAGWMFEGLDVNEAAAAFACRMGFRVTVGQLDDIAGQRFDAVAIWNCFEQLPDPRAAAVSARRLLNTGGTLALRVPNGQAYATMRRALSTPLAPIARAFLAHDNLLGFPYRHGFTSRSLSWLLGEVGFGEIRVRGDPLVPVADRWTRWWARAEEKALKTLLRAAGGHRRLGRQYSPWLEVYARAH